MKKNPFLSIKTPFTSWESFIHLQIPRSCDFLSTIPVGTPLPDDTWRASLSEATPSRLPKEGHVVRSPIRTSSGRSTRHSQTSHLRICCPDRWLKWASLTTSFWQPAYHSPRSATCRAKGQEWWQVTSHDLWQPSVGWWWPYHHIEASWRAKKSPYH